METKICTKCGKEKPLNEFWNTKAIKSGKASACSKCLKEHRQKYRRSMKGLVAAIYDGENGSSKRRSHPKPEYSQADLCEFIFNNPKFYELYDEWVASGYKKNKKPSIDRIDDSKHYSLDNIQLVTWRENNVKSHICMMNGEYDGKCKAIIQYDLEGNFVEEYYSINSAERIINVNHTHIGDVCKGKRITAGGYKWKYKE